MKNYCSSTLCHVAQSICVCINDWTLAPPTKWLLFKMMSQQIQITMSEHVGVPAVWLTCRLIIAAAHDKHSLCSQLCSHKHHQSLGDRATADASIRPVDLTMRTSLSRLWDVVESFPCVGMENSRRWGWGGWCLDKTKYCFRELQEPSQRQR